MQKGGGPTGQPRREKPSSARGISWSRELSGGESGSEEKKEALGAVKPQTSWGTFLLNDGQGERKVSWRTYKDSIVQEPSIKLQVRHFCLNAVNNGLESKGKSQRA